jgi:hypothetical protein
MGNSVKLRRSKGREKGFVCTVENQGIMQTPAGRRKMDKISIETKATTRTKDKSHTHARDHSIQKQSSITPFKAMSLPILWPYKRHSR